MSAILHQPSADSRRDAALRWLFDRINYERTVQVPYHERQLKLDRMRQLLTRLGNPDKGLKIVHIAGTKGKGSTAAMLGAVLRAAGYRTGVFSSPHLDRIEERFAVDGAACSADEFSTLVERIRPIVRVMDDEAAGVGGMGDGPTYFEVTTAIALQHFADQHVDVAVLEVGLGGRLDSTNVCLPIVSAITNISRDHTKQLGNCLASIAREKAGIIKPGIPVVSGVTGDEPRAVIQHVAREHGCRLIQLGRDFHFRYRPASDGGGSLEFTYATDADHLAVEGARLALLGRHQAANAAVALAALAELRHQGWCLSTDALRAGLASASLPGRIEQFTGSPTVIVDTAHNVASAIALVDTLHECFGPGPRRLVLSASRDKDVRGIVQSLAPHFHRFIVTEYQENPRAVPVDQLTQLLRDELTGAGRSEASVESIATPAAAWEHVLRTAHPNEMVCITGSFFLAAEMRRLVCAQARTRFTELADSGQ